MIDKYNLTTEQNVFLAKKLIISNIYNSARMEGCNVTFPETQTILDGVNVPNVKLDDINCILNLRDAWKFVINNPTEEFNLEYICKINGFVSRNESIEWGILRNGRVGISGTNYIPDIPVKENVIKEIGEVNKIKEITKRAIKYLLYGVRGQLFWDGNKRTSFISANKILIENGKGIITVKEEYLKEFNILLTNFYDTNDSNDIEEFLYNNCIYGLEI